MPFMDAIASTSSSTRRAFALVLLIPIMLLFGCGKSGNATGGIAGSGNTGNSGNSGNSGGTVEAPVITSFSAGASAIASGTSTTLTAVFSGGNGVVSNGVGAVASGTPVNISPSSTTSYTLTVTNSAGASVTAQVTVTVLPNNQANITVGFGPLGETGGYVNGIFTTVTVCQPGTQNCVAIPNVLVDTGSVGLRVLASALESVSLPQISVGGNPLLECVQFGDTSYTWGTMATAAVNIAGETASSLPVQVLGTTSLPVPPSCLSTPLLPGYGNDDTVQSLGANGILGIGNGAVDGPWDCGSYCEAYTTYSPYFTCPGGTCGEVLVSTKVQDENPVAAFASADTNGVIITLPSVPGTGESTVSGTLTFGINTQPDNALGSAVVYPLDECDDFPQVNYGGLAYYDSFCSGTASGLGGFMDTGSNALYVSDSTTLSSEGLPIIECPSNSSGSGFYCISGGGSTTLSNITLISNGTTTGTVSLSISNATNLINSHNAALNDIGGDSGPPGDYADGDDFFDFGLPFFLGRTVFVGITGPSGMTSGTFAATAPNGFVAF
jgi:hypothetical protein